jgi:hypothetical protein
VRAPEYAEVSCVGFRSAAYFLFILGKWPNCSSKEQYAKRRAKVVAWVRAVLTAMAPYTTASYNTLGDVGLDAVKADLAAQQQDGAAASSSAVAAAAAAASADAAPIAVVAKKSGGGWSPEQYARLQRIKHRYDPTNVLRNNNNILPQA